MRAKWMRILLVSGRFWSGVLAAAAFARGSSYIERPPRDSFSSSAIEAFIPYSVWGIILLVSVLLVAVGHSSMPLRNLAIVGHTICVFAYLTFGFSVIWSAVFYGQPWTTAGSLMVVGLLHAARAIFLAEEIAHSRPRRSNDR